MHLKRVIPCLDVDAGRVVKGTNFVNIRDAGDPVEAAARYEARLVRSLEHAGLDPVTLRVPSGEGAKSVRAPYLPLNRMPRRLA